MDHGVVFQTRKPVHSFLNKNPKDLNCGSYVMHVEKITR